MATAPTQPSEAVQAPSGPQLNIRAQFTRSLTFTNPGAGKRFEKTPSITVNINVDASKASDTDFMVGLRVEAAAKTDDAEIYTLKLEYAGHFALSNVEQNLLEPLLLVECPRLLFPFARRIIADVTRDGGYQPMMLDPVDFVALYRNELTRRQTAEAAKAPIN